MSYDIIIADVWAQKDVFLSTLTDKSINFEREAGFAVQQLTANDYIAKVAIANRQAVVNAITNIAAIGISLNPAKKQAYLVPRDGKICLVVSYMGLMQLAMDTGSIKWAQAALVYEQDHFQLNGFENPPTHNFDPFNANRGAVKGAYVVVKTADEDYLTTAMSMDEICSIRDRSSAWKNGKEGKRGPWESDFGEMAKKTCVNRGYKFWPKTERLEKAIHYLNTEAGEGIVINGAVTEKVKEKPLISGERFSKALEAIKSGSYTVEKIKANFALTVDQETVLNDIEGGVC